jgi:hypothetical protein
MTTMVTVQDIEAARRRIASNLRRAPLRLSQALSQRMGIPVHLKLENLQHTGSFKLRGATNALLCLDEKARSRGLVTASTGRWCSDRRVSGRLSLMPLLLGSLSVPDRIRACTFQHSIEDGAADGDLRLLGAE